MTSGNRLQGPCVAAQTVLTKEDGTLAYDWKVGGTIHAKGIFRPSSVP